MNRAFSCRVAFLVALLGCLWLPSPSVQAQDEFVESGPSGSPLATVTGRIKPNPARGRSSAPFVVVDRSGQVQYLLRSRSGVNLARFVNQEVQLRGSELAGSGNSPPTLDVQNLAPRRTAGQSAHHARPPRNMPPRPAAHDHAAHPHDLHDHAAHSQMGRRQPSFPTSADLVDAPPSETRHAVHNGTGQGEAATAAALETVEVPEPQSVMKQAPQPLDPPGELPPEEPFAGEANGDRPGWEPGGYCGTCGGPTFDGCCNACGPPGLVWLRAEYLYWWTQGMYVPPLVTTGPSAQQPGYLDTPGTTILFGDEHINDYGRSVRFTVGTWLDACQTLGIEGDYYFVGTANTNYFASSNGDPILSRPFYDLSPTQADPLQIVGQNVEQVASPGSIAGSVAVDAATNFQSAGVRMLWNLCCSSTCYDDDCFPMWNGPGGRRVDFLLGYRYARLSDSLAINEDLTSLQTAAPGSFLVNDTFQTQNIFNGAELGAMWTGYRGRWLATLTGKLALGNVYEAVSIRGSTTTTQNGNTTTDTGGLLAQSTNIGDYSRNQFAVMPELGTNIGFSLTPRLRVLVGYTFVYLSRVVRPGDQIDLDVNSRLLPNDTRPPAGDMRHPQFVFRDTDFWAQGINVGLDYRW